MCGEVPGHVACREVITTLPMLVVHREGGGDVPPSTFVAAKLLRDAQEGRPAQRVTRVAQRTLNPTWGELLQVIRGCLRVCV